MLESTTLKSECACHWERFVRSKENNATLFSRRAMRFGQFLQRWRRYTKRYIFCSTDGCGVYCGGNLRVKCVSLVRSVKYSRQTTTLLKQGIFHHFLRHNWVDNILHWTADNTTAHQIAFRTMSNSIYHASRNDITFFSDWRNLHSRQLLTWLFESLLLCFYLFSLIVIGSTVLTSRAVFAIHYSS